MKFLILLTIIAQITTIILEQVIEQNGVNTFASLARIGCRDLRFLCGKKTIARYNVRLLSFEPDKN
jgi:hypothetical protein